MSIECGECERDARGGHAEWCSRAKKSANDSVQRLVHPRRETPRNSDLGKLLDTIHERTDDAIHKGFCHRKGKVLDKALADIISAAEAGRDILRMNTKENKRKASRSSDCSND